MMTREERIKAYETKSYTVFCLFMSGNDDDECYATLRKMREEMEADGFRFERAQVFGFWNVVK
jgi:hypothetical protein